GDREAEARQADRRARGAREHPDQIRVGQPMTKTPTRSPTHEDIDLTRLASMGLEIEDIADGETVALPALVELAEDRGRPVSHYLAAIPLATELRLAGDAPLTIKVCAGTCQRWG